MFEVSRMFQVYVEEVSSRREGCYFFVVVGGGSLNFLTFIPYLQRNIKNPYKS